MFPRFFMQTRPAAVRATQINRTHTFRNDINLSLSALTKDIHKLEAFLTATPDQYLRVEIIKRLNVELLRDKIDHTEWKSDEVYKRLGKMLAESGSPIRINEHGSTYLAAAPSFKR